MISLKKEVVKELSKILPTHYELLISSPSIPCITYMESDNADTQIGDNIGYSRVIYTIKLWGSDLKQLEPYELKIGNCMRELGYKRISYNELWYDDKISMIMRFEGLAFENY